MMADGLANGLADDAAKTVLCLASYEKGHEFLREAKRLGWRVLLLTVTALEAAGWPRESLDEIFYLSDLARVDDVIVGVSSLARTHAFARIVPLDDYDVLTTATLREHLRLPGMGLSAARLVRDKLAMRVRARARDLPVPDFVHTLNNDAIRAFVERTPPPWVLKPRAEVSTIGIQRVGAPEEIWSRLEALGERQSFFVLECYIPGDVYHVDTIMRDGEVLFAEAHQYGRPPLDIFHEGGLAITRTLPRDGEDARALLDLNQRVLAALELQRGAAHVEFIKGRDDGRFYFLEAGARVGGASIADLVEAATGLNLWREWARLELADEAHPYQAPVPRTDYAGLIVTLARQEHPDTSAYADPEIVWRMDRHHHAGLIVASPDPARVQTLLDDYAARFAEDFFATLPPLTDPTQMRGAHAGEQGGEGQQ